METVYNLFLFLLALGLICFAMEFISAMFWWAFIGLMCLIGFVWEAIGGKK